jgi:hypothetical protein
VTGLHLRRHPTASFMAVFRNEKRLTGWQHSALAARALDRLIAEELGKRKERKCLCCNEPFMSEGPQNRLCSRHRAAGTGLGRDMTG